MSSYVFESLFIEQRRMHRDGIILATEIASWLAEGDYLSASEALSELNKLFQRLEQ